MVDDKGIKQAAERLDVAARESYKAAVDHAFELQKDGMKLSRAFFENWVETLKEGGELNRRALEDLQRLAVEQRQVFYGLSRESRDAYDGFVEALSSYQRELEEKTTGQGSREDYLELLERTGELKRGSGRLPDDFWGLPRPKDPEGLVRSAVQEDRR